MQIKKTTHRITMFYILISAVLDSNGRTKDEW
jgi:hypothetical protein